MTLDELKTLLALNGNVRIPYAEDEIFVDKELYLYYLEALCKEYEWYKYYTPLDDTEHAWLALNYSNYIIKGRWIEAESIIATDPHWAYHYAKDVIKGRWPEAEAVIASDPCWSYWYNLKFSDNI
jgi:hypothetical protein